MVKKEELMIGDYVSVSGTPLKIAALGTVKAGFLDGKGEMFYHSYDNIHPIPLTDEILINYGFEGTPTRDLFIEKNLWETYAIELFPSDGSWIIRITDKTNKHNDGCNRINLYINHIHELQHALRLCGIERRIEP